MKYVNINNYKARIEKSKKYELIKLKFTFEMDYIKENIIYLDILSEYNMKCNKIYKTAKTIVNKAMSLYSIDGGLFTYIEGDKILIDFSVTMCDPNVLKDNYFEEAMEFSSNMLFKPRFDDLNELNIIKNNMITNRRESYKNPKSISVRNLTENIYSEEVLNKNRFVKLSDYEEFVNNITFKNLRKVYKEMLNSFVGLIIIGNIKDNYLDLIGKYFNFENIKDLESDYFNNEVFLFKNNYKKDTDKNIDNTLCYGVFLAKEQNEMYSNILLYLLKSTRVLREVLRDDMGLVYGAGVEIVENQAIIFDASIAKENQEKIFEGFMECINRLKNRDYLKEKIEYLYSRLNQSLYLMDEKISTLTGEIYKEVYKNLPTLKKIYNYVEKLDIDDFILYLESFELKFKYVYEGVKNEK